MRIIFLLAFFFSTWLMSFTAAAQNTPAKLAVFRESETDAASVLKDLSRTSSDTNRVFLFVKTARIYWYQKTAENHALDSCFIYAKQAYDLSIQLKFTAGSNEGSFLLCKVYTKKTPLNRQWN